jgi:hypothetical protein
MFPVSTRVLIQRTWIQCQSQQMLRTGAEQSIPERHNKGAIIDTLRPNHDKSEAMPVMKRFCWKWIAVNPLYTVVFGMTKHQTVEQNKMTLAFGRILQFQCPKESNYLKNNTYNKYKPYYTKSFKFLALSFFCEHCYSCLQILNNSQQTPWRKT